MPFRHRVVEESISPSPFLLYSRRPDSFLQAVLTTFKTGTRTQNQHMPPPPPPPPLLPSVEGKGALIPERELRVLTFSPFLYTKRYFWRPIFFVWKEKGKDCTVGF